ncbi:MAG: peptidylprolyl isomerase [Gammaproteobacteria bacterium]|nr:peptidylprolyl isomerase [Gammaproteobacteria bacterium]
MKNIHRLMAVTALGSILMLQTSLSAAESDKKLAAVNGQAITQAQLEQFMLTNYAAAKQKPSEADAMEEMIRHRLLLQDAEKKSLAKDPKFVEQMEELRSRLLVSFTLTKYLADNAVSDADIAKEYEKRRPEMIRSEYKASHILVATEDEAKGVIAKLGGGADFATLAAELSTDPGSKDNAGDLGWFSAQQMVKPFSDAVVAMSDGALSKTPVQSQFGWHVIKREAERKSEPPTLEMLKGQLRQLLQQQQINDYLDALAAAGKIEKF